MKKGQPVTVPAPRRFRAGSILRVASREHPPARATPRAPPVSVAAGHRASCPRLEAPEQRRVGLRKQSHVPNPGEQSWHCSEPSGSRWPRLNVVRTDRLFSPGKQGGGGRKPSRIPVSSVRSHISSEPQETGDEMTAEIWQGPERETMCALGPEVPAGDSSRWIVIGCKVTGLY